MDGPAIDPASARSALERVSFDSVGNQGEGGLEAWRELTRPILEVTPLDPSGRFHSRFDFCDVSSLVFNKTRYSATRFDRTQGQTRSGEFDLIALHMVLRGRETLLIDGQVHEMTPGKVVIRDWGRPFLGESTECEQLSIILPRELIERSDDLYSRSPFLSWDASTPSGRILASAMKEGWDSLDELDATASTQFAGGFLGLLNGLIDATIDKGNPRIADADATRVAMQRFLLEHLPNPLLGVEHLSQVFQVSRASVYRHFKACGGVASFIREMRLAACLRDLSRPGADRIPIARIAERWGFADVAHFHRLFRNRYGMTPKAAAQASQGGTQTDPLNANRRVQLPEISRIHAWVNRKELSLGG